MRIVNSEPRSNPLTIVAVVTALSLAVTVYRAIVQQDLDTFVLLRVIVEAAFLFFYARRLRWAWHVAVAIGPLFFCVYWAQYFLGGLGHQPYFPTIGALRIVFLLHLAIVSGLLIWLFRIRKRYFFYINEALPERT